jgi:hypothetical protein
LFGHWTYSQISDTEIVDQPLCETLLVGMSSSKAFQVHDKTEQALWMTFSHLISTANDSGNYKRNNGAAQRLKAWRGQEVRRGCRTGLTHGRKLGVGHWHMHEGRH